MKAITNKVFIFLLLTLLIATPAFAKMSAWTDMNPIFGWIGGAGRWAGLATFLFGAFQLGNTFFNEGQTGDMLNGLKLVAAGVVIFNAGWICYIVFNLG